ncbi:diguanylate cyclase (GGDEF)-like protein/PAS domain S-box-containing protein [Microvirga lupini]|uniref:Diguanylate cyclase (GGDEF)-like protein/PAS domain S-box-containing protein n=1 Tax=Microvirga lupini TaxID=420324 RepID=A0A7W4VME2_9HYPH|nr:EAL domain-containing protein [Microvirga lupini]MBB3019859.1 diguanylate cyclase (GGDEF)-like protein/PAS domain S-box-containing protein [Microvirga lupini]
MLTVYDCIVTEHDLRLVALAALVCALASLTAVNLLHHVLRLERMSRGIWLTVAAAATGFGIWATHFIAMLAYSPALPTAYNVTLTAVSLIAAVLLTGFGFGIALLPGLTASRWAGGAAVGGGIAVMHYTGMAAFEVAGTLAWDPTLVTASILLGGLLGAAAVAVALHRATPASKITGALLLTLAICSHHFTAMGAVSITPDPTIALSSSAIPSRWLALGVAVVSLVILLLAFIALILDVRDRRRATLEMQRMRDLTDAALEGLVLCAGETIVTVNQSFARLTGLKVEQIGGQNLAAWIPDALKREILFAAPGQAIEAELRHGDGTLLPVELIARPINYKDHPHNVIAVRDLRDRRNAEAQIRFLAHHDPLTGLGNRASFDQRLDREITLHGRSGRQLALLCLDLDGFKDVNDLHGHAAGDQLLKDIAKHLSTALAEDQMLARLGGDEFAVIVPSVADPAHVGQLAETLLKSLKDIDGTDTPTNLVSVSIGIALYPSDAKDRTELLSSADTALYRAKTEGKGTYRFFEADMGAQIRERRSLEHDLRSAIANGEFNLVYQPQAQVDTGAVNGFEVLLRWIHPARGSVPPALFIPIAEESGLILKIGEWVMREACREAATWMRPLTVGVNVSAVQLTSDGFADLVRRILDETGLPPQRLEIEITETALIRDPNRALQTLQKLKSLGISIAMDDFGTGYSSLSNLRAFPCDKIKIDRSFIQAVHTNPQAATIVRAVLGLGRGLGLPVIAEGVETSEELSFLDMEGCTEAQGYLFGRPAPIEEFVPLLSENVVVLPTSPARTMAK